MYFLTALFCTIVSALLLFFFRDRKALHLDVLTIIFGSATLMWFVDCIFCAAEGEGFISFTDPADGVVAVWTLLGGIALWIVISFILNNCKKQTIEN